MSSQLTWISDAFVVPVTLLEPTFGVLGDLFGRKRLLVGGSALMVVGEPVSVLVPGAGTSRTCGSGCCGPDRRRPASAPPCCSRHRWPWSSLARSPQAPAPFKRARSIAIWAAALSSDGFASPVLGGLVAKIG